MIGIENLDFMDGFIIYSMMFVFLSIPALMLVFVNSFAKSLQKKSGTISSEVIEARWQIVGAAVPFFLIQLIPFYRIKKLAKGLSLIIPLHIIFLILLPIIVINLMSNNIETSNWISVGISNNLFTVLPIGTPAIFLPVYFIRKWTKNYNELAETKGGEFWSLEGRKGIRETSVVIWLFAALHVWFLVSASNSLVINSEMVKSIEINQLIVSSLIVGVAISAGLLLMKLRRIGGVLAFVTLGLGFFDLALNGTSPTTMYIAFGPVILLLALILYYLPKGWKYLDKKTTNNLKQSDVEYL